MSKMVTTMEAIQRNLTNRPEADTHRPATVLVVDDEQNILSSLRRVLRPEGYHVLTADSGNTGLDLLKEHRVDVVISDMRMPHMDGATFLSRAYHTFPKVQRILLTGFADVSSTINAVNNGHIFRYIRKPWEDGDLKMTVRQALEIKRSEDERLKLLKLTHRQNQKLKQFNHQLEQMVSQRTQQLNQATSQLDKAYHDLHRSYVQAIPIFANLIEMREGSSRGHARRVGEMAREMALAMHLDDDQIEDIYFAALLHDVGKLGLPDHILNQYEPNLKPRDKTLLHKHPVLGQAAIMALETLEEAGKIIRAHHERYDGRGYPDGLTQEQIPIGARILAVANDFDELQLGHIIGHMMSVDEAAEFIEAHAGSRYDPSIVRIFLSWLNHGDTQISNIPELSMTRSKLKPGMTLSRDLYNHQGILLLARGHTVDERIIERIGIFEQDEDRPFQIHVYNKPLKETERVQKNEDEKLDRGE